MRRRTPELLHRELVSAAESKARHQLHGDEIRARAVLRDIDKLLDEMREP